MDPQEYERLKFIAETHRKAHDTRRRYEWKTMTMTITFYVLVTTAAYAGDFFIPELRYAGELDIVWLISIALSILSITYLLMLHRANDDNKSIAEAAENAIIDACENRDVIEARNAARNRRLRKSERTKQKPTSPRRRWSFVWQAITILYFAIVATHLTIKAQPIAPPKAESR